MDDENNKKSTSENVVDVELGVMPTGPNQRVFTAFEVVGYLAEQRSLCSKYINDLKQLKRIIFAPMPQKFSDRCKNLQ